MTMRREIKSETIRPRSLSHMLESNRNSYGELVRTLTPYPCSGTVI